VEKELEVAVKAACEAASIIRKIQDSDNWTAEQKEGGKGPLTEADLASNDLLIKLISEAFPNDAILSEETVDDPNRVNNDRCWIIDPLDGTREFTLGIPEFCVSVGFVYKGEAVVGALCNPATGETITGAKGIGVKLNDSLACVTKHKQIPGARFLVSRSEHKKGWFDQWKDEVELQPMGSVAWKLGLVAVGQAEATFTPKPRNEWDLCAGVACINAAGGHATNGAGDPYRFNCPDPLKIGVCGTNGAIHEAVLGMMQS
jgi:myo-inositol-1(or 4)-monophosphatase